MLRILTIMGTRPEAIKLAPLVKAFSAHECFENILFVTAQHRQMIDQILDLFELKPDIDLMRPNQDLFSLTAKIITSVKGAIHDLEPDFMIVQGDTTTTMVSALGAFFSGVPIGHVEAGLRIWNLRAPFPEEANRRIVTRLVDLHFCPTERNRENLVREGVDQKTIYVTGNTVIDALLWIRDRVPDLSSTGWNRCWGNVTDIIASDSPVVLITIQRRENFGQGIRQIVLQFRN